VPTIERLMEVLDYRFLELADARDRKNALNRRSFLSEEEYDHRVQQIDDEVREREYDIHRALIELVLHPPHHARHFEKLASFYGDDANARFETCVFIMTKFPEGRSKVARQLGTVIETVKAGVKERGYVPRIGTEPKRHDWIWDNVELYLLGCARGIALVEDKFKKELNPNVAMEWGWMRAMNRPVLALKAKGFKYQRADWAGLIEDEFDWEDPEPAITKALEGFLPQR